MSTTKLYLGIGALILVAATSKAEPGTDDGFVLLFDGKSLAGWKTTGNWLVEAEGTVTLKPRPGEEGWQRFDAYIMTERTYTDFILDLEFKIEKTGNSRDLF